MEWHYNQTKDIIYSFNGNQNLSNCACFDLDWTLIKPKSGNVFPTDKNDWQFLFPNTLSKILQLQNNFKIIIFTNQPSISNDLLSKFNNIIQHFNHNVYFIVSITKSYYRKPNTGMWDFLNQYLINSNYQINKLNSFYCGDAAGRCKNWKPNTKKDFSNSDLCFAKNIDLQFYTPDYLFNQNNYNQFYIQNHIYHPNQEFNIPINPNENIKNLIVLIGRPSSGKSLFANYLKSSYNFKILNKDLLKTKKKITSKFLYLLNQKENIVIDSQNVDRKSRHYFLDQAPNYHKIAIFISTSHDKSRHLNKFRLQILKENAIHIPDVVYHLFNKKFEYPSLNEGFQNIIEFDFPYSLLPLSSKKRLNHFYS